MTTFHTILGTFTRTHQSWRRIIRVSISVMFGLSIAPSVFAVDALQVLPTRIVMEAQRSSELTLVNKGDEAGSYRIILRNIRTDEFGKFTTAEKAEGDELFADKLIRFSPRRVTIEAGAYQKVRVMVRKPKGLKEGEYRTHMVFQSLPKQQTNALDENQEDLSVSVDPIVEVSIPVIIRHGKLTTELEIENPDLDNEKMVFKLNRKGTRSTYGDVEVLINSGSKKGNRVGYVRGLSVYYPNEFRQLRVPLQLPSDFKQGKDGLLVRFIEDPTYGGEHTVTGSYSP